MGKMQRDKGARFEREIVKKLNGGGVQAERIPLSGAAGGSFSGDIVAEVPFNEIHKDTGVVLPCSYNILLELKKRANGFKSLYQWLEGNDALVIGADRKEPLIVMPLDTWLKQVGINDSGTT